MSYCFNPDKMETLRSVVKEIQRSLGGGIMKIKDMQTLPEFFGVYQGDHIWIEGNLFVVEGNRLRSDFDYLSAKIDSQALVGCLTGQLEWSREMPMLNKLEGLLRELAARMPAWSRISWSDDIGLVFIYDGPLRSYNFRPMDLKPEEYEMLRAHIVEQQSDINLDDYRESN